MGSISTSIRAITQCVRPIRQGHKQIRNLSQEKRKWARGQQVSEQMVSLLTTAPEQVIVGTPPSEPSPEQARVSTPPPEPSPEQARVSTPPPEPSPEDKLYQKMELSNYSGESLNRLLTYIDQKYDFWSRNHCHCPLGCVNYSLYEPVETR